MVKAGQSGHVNDAGSWKTALTSVTLKSGEDVTGFYIIKFGEE
jgi:hypothetical protein